MPLQAAVVLGHSHTGALAAAVARRGDDTRGDPRGDSLHLALFEAWRYEGGPPFTIPTESGAQVFNPAVIAGARAACAGAEHPRFFAMLGGNAHAALSLMRHPRPFDFLLPDAEDLPLDPAAEILPLSYVEQVLREQMDRYLDQLQLLRQAVPDRIYAFAPPPPIGDDGFIAGRLDAFFLQNAARRELSPPALRRKMWLLQTRLQRRLCETNGVALVEPPPAAWTADGFLDPACYGDDATHGGPHYGELVLQQIEALCRAPLQSWSTFDAKAP